MNTATDIQQSITDPVMSQEIPVTAYFSNSGNALALAQLVKRMSFSDVRANAVDDDEAYRMMDALSELQDGLVESGYNPR